MTYAPMSAALALLLVTSPVAAGEPRLLDSIGIQESDARALAVNGNPNTWVPEVSFFLEFDGWSQEDVVLVEWREGKKVIGKPFVCATAHFMREVQDNPTTPIFAANLARFTCRFPDAAGISRPGIFELGLTYKQTLAGKTWDLGRLEMRVVEILVGSANKPVTSYADDRDHQLGLTTIEEYFGEHGEPEADLRVAAKIHHRLLAGGVAIAIRFWTKYDDTGPRTITMTCLQGDQKVGEGRNVLRGRKSGSTTFVGKDRQDVNYVQQGFALNGMRPGKNPGSGGAPFYLGDHPGDYRCVAMAGGEIVKEVFFSVGADGEIQRTACDDEARTLRQVHIVSAKEHAIANLPRDEKIAARGAFFGRVTWKAGCRP